MTLTTTCFAEIQADKVKHFAVGYIINDQLKSHTHLTFLERFGVVLTIAYIKENHDPIVDKNDIAATALGSVIFEVKF